MRAGSLRGLPRTQTQLAVTTDEKSWFLLNASPDLRQQILATPELSPQTGRRSSPIEGVVLTSADVDAVMGLLHLREFHPLRIYATKSIRRIVTEENRIFRTLERSSPPVEWIDLPLREEVRLMPKLACTAVPMGGAFPDYVVESFREKLAPEEAVVSLILADGARKVFVAPGLPGKNDEWMKYVQGSELAFLDGTFWSENELTAIRGSGKSAREMGHLPLSGPGGLLEMTQNAPHARRVAIHINNTNPILDEESAEYHALLKSGWQIARDGMEFVL